MAIQDLRVQLNTKHGRVVAVDRVSLEIERSKTLAVVGESGSGKTMTFLAAMGLVQKIAPAEVSGRVWFEGTDILAMSNEERRRVRGRRVAMILQNPLSALNPVVRVGSQIAESIRVHEGISRDQALRKAVESLSLARIPRASDAASSYPHELSGGMRQRAVIAMAIAGRPDVLIADEPTTALDVTLEAEILGLLDSLREELEMSLVLITHDLGLVSKHAHNLAVMYAGRVVELAPIELVSSPAHPYTSGLLASRPGAHGRGERPKAIPGEPPDLATIRIGCAFEPRCFLGHGRALCVSSTPELDTFTEGAHRAACHFAEDLPAAARSMASRTEAIGGRTSERLPRQSGAKTEPALRVEHLVKDFPVRASGRGSAGRHIRAVDDISFELPRRKTLGIVGESGSGKTTLARILLRLIQPTSGKVWLDGKELTNQTGRQLRETRKQIQAVFQDPQAALNPRMKVEAIVSEPLVIHGQWSDDGPDRVVEILKAVGLKAEHSQRYPHEFSGGQQQRIGLARALILNPSVVILDEPTSALDVSISAQIINLLSDVQAQLGTTYVLIAHDLSLVSYLCDYVAVMHSGRFLETGPAAKVYDNPIHPYTQSLLDAMPTAPDKSAPKGASVRLPLVEDVHDRPSGCSFHPRCPLATQIGSTRTLAVASVNERRIPVECAEVVPTWFDDDGHGACCHFIGTANQVSDYD